MDKVKRYLFWLTVVPALITFWSFISTAVYFVDEINYVRSQVTPQAVREYEATIQNLKDRVQLLEDE